MSIGKNLKKYRLLNNLSLRDVSNKLNISTTLIARYEHDEAIPNSEKLINFSKLYKCKCLDILNSYDKYTIDDKLINFRKKEKLKGYRLDLINNIINESINKYLEIIELNNIKNKRIKKYSIKNYNEIDFITNSIRKDLDYSTKSPIYNIINLLEDNGFYIIEINNKNNLFDDFNACSIIINDIPFIIINNNIRDGSIQRFNILHEVGHILLNIDEKLNKEKVCDLFSSSMLMPKDSVIDRFSNKRTNISFYEIESFKQEFRVGYICILKRLLELNIISIFIYKKYSKFIYDLIGNKDEFPIDPDHSNKFKYLTHKLCSREIISVNKACELLGETLDEYQQEDNNYGYKYNN